jgi:hypothetical protein
MEKKRGSTAAINEIVKLGGRISVSDMAVISDVAELAGGSLTSVEPDGEWCGTGTIRIKWPPKKNRFYELLDALVDRRINFEVLINGIPAPEEIMIHISRRYGH